MNDAHEQYDPVYALVATRQGPLFAGRHSGLFYTTDGTTWASLPVDPTPGRSRSITALVQTPEGSDLFAGSYGYVVRLTIDGTLHLVSVLPRPLPMVTTLVVSPNYVHDGIVLAGTAKDGVFRSIDRGEYWVPWNIGLLDHRIIDLVVSPTFAVDETVFAATESGVFYSVNGGRSWRMSAFPCDDDPVLCLAVSSGLAQNVMVYAGTEGGMLLVSHDQGRNWCSMTGITIGDQPI
ncbi:WD40/YVTN/BNR-like repeat-containing protein, partial [Roseiflexus sp.]